MFGGRKQILSPFTARKKRKTWNKTREKNMTEEKRQNLTKADKGSNRQGICERLLLMVVKVMIGKIMMRVIMKV